MSTKGKSCEKVADRVMRASAAAIPRLMCPLCGGPLSIQYTDLNNPGRRKRRALSVMCKRCVWRVISDGLPYEPPWVSVFGRKITTGEIAQPAKLVLKGATAGLRKVALHKLLHDKARLSLSDAKRSVDELLEGNEVAIHLQDAQHAEALMAEAAELGAFGAVSAESAAS